jgi:hypothetical protein
MSAHSNNPDPQIIQLRGIIEHLGEQHYRGFAQLREEATNIELALALCDRLIEQYPALTRAGGSDD